MSEPLDLDALEALAEAAAIGDGDLTDMDDVIAAVPALVARVRELEAERDRWNQRAEQAALTRNEIANQRDDEFRRTNRAENERRRVQIENADLRARLEAAEADRDTFKEIHRCHELRADENAAELAALRDAIEQLADEWSGRSMQIVCDDAAKELAALIQSDTGGEE